MGGGGGLGGVLRSSRKWWFYDGKVRDPRSGDVFGAALVRDRVRGSSKEGS